MQGESRVSPAGVPRVSVGMPVYNGEDYLEAAIESVLAQNFGDFELVISDNASTDRTAAICERYARDDPRIRYRRNARNLGAAPNYNLVFERARGEYFKWASHDDRCAPDLLARCVDVFDREPAAVLCFTRFEYVNEEDRTIRQAGGDLSVRGGSPAERVQRLVDRQLRGEDIYWAIFGLVRSSALRQTRLIEPYISSDQTLLFHLALLGDLVEVDELLFFRRAHEGESMVRHRAPQDRARWFDTSARRARAFFPNWRLVGEHLALLRSQPLPPSQALICSYQVLRRFSRKWRALGGEVKAAGLGLLGGEARDRT